jgi:hypothetical protein
MKTTVRSRLFQAGVVSAAVIAVSCSALLKMAGYPPEAMRATPPTEMASAALAVGSQAPSMRLTLSDGRTVSVPGGEGSSILVFYRGQW